jgi:hypothetical protein
MEAGPWTDNADRGQLRWPCHLNAVCRGDLTGGECGMGDSWSLSANAAGYREATNRNQFASGRKGAIT